MKMINGKIIKIGDSLGVIFKREILDLFDLKEKDEVYIKLLPSAIQIIKKVKIWLFIQKKKRNILDYFGDENMKYSKIPNDLPLIRALTLCKLYNAWIESRFDGYYWVSKWITPNIPNYIPLSRNLPKGFVYWKINLMIFQVFHIQIGRASCRERV